MVGDGGSAGGGGACGGAEGGAAGLSVAMLCSNVGDSRAVLGSNVARRAIGGAQAGAQPDLRASAGSLPTNVVTAHARCFTQQDLRQLHHLYLYLSICVSTSIYLKLSLCMSIYLYLPIDLSIDLYLYLYL